MHDVGKDLGWIRQLVKRLVDRAGQDAPLAAQIARVHELTESVVKRTRRFVADATEPRHDRSGAVRLDKLLDRVLRPLRTAPGGERLTLANDPTIRGVRCHENVGRALADLVDTGMRSTTQSETVRVAATLREGWIQITVAEQCRGTRCEQLQTRPQAAAGELAFSRDLVEALGGRIAVGVDAEHRRCATLRVPIASQQGPQ